MEAGALLLKAGPGDKVEGMVRIWSVTEVIRCQR